MIWKQRNWVWWNMQCQDIYQQLYFIIIPYSNMQGAKELLTGCPLGCSCQRCLALGFTERLILENPDTLIYSGPIMTRLPVSNFHTMVGTVSLTYKSFHTYAMGDLVKLKATYSDFMPGLSRIYLTLRPDEHKDEITVNQLDAALWFIHIVRAKLFGVSNYGIPYRKYEGKIIGKVWIKRFFEGWVLTGVEVTDRLRIEKENEIRNIKQFWTRFEIIDVEGLCLVVKFWDFLTKWEIGIPLKELGLWLSAFLSLLKS